MNKKLVISIISLSLIFVALSSVGIIEHARASQMDVQVKERTTEVYQTTLALAMFATFPRIDLDDTWTLNSTHEVEAILKAPEDNIEQATISYRINIYSNGTAFSGRILANGELTPAILLSEEHVEYLKNLKLTDS